MAGRGPDHPVDRGPLVAAIIAGGRAVRLGGRVKALIEIDGETILDRQRALLAPRVDAIVISANDAAPFADTGLEVVADRAEGGGPMLGIAAALEATGADWLLALGSDMPNVSGAVLDLLFARARRRRCGGAVGRRPPGALARPLRWVGAGGPARRAGRRAALAHGPFVE